MTNSRPGRRTVLRGMGVASGLALAGPVVAETTTEDGEGCTPGHSPDDQACQQVAADADALTTFDAGGTGLLVDFSYPCGWQTSTTDQFDDRFQANATRSGIGDAGAYVDVQVRTYYEPVGDDFLETEASEGSSVEFDYEYAGQTRTAIVTGPSTDDFGTVAHAAVPFQGELVHVEVVSTATGLDCAADPRPDYWLVRDVLSSIQPNAETTFGARSEHFESPAAVTVSDQVAADAGTLVTVDSVYVPAAGFVVVHDGQPDDWAAVLGASAYLSTGSHQNVQVRLDSGLGGGARNLVVAAHRDTDDDQVFGYVTSDGAEDGPYRVGGAPVTDTAAVSVPTTARTTGTTTTTTATTSPTSTSTRTTTTPATTSTTTTGSGETRSDGSPGFTPVATVLALGAALVALLDRD